MTDAARRGRILCVDDEPHILRALQWLLKKQFDVLTATSAGEGIRLLQRNDFDVVISDQRMPGITGVEFLREVRKTAPRAVRILLTGYAELDAMVRSVNESEVFRFVTKPWNVKTLPDLIAEAVEIANVDTVLVSDDAPVEILDFTAAQATQPVAPAQAAATGTVLPNDPATMLHAMGRSILVMDDDPAVHRAVDEVLARSERVLHAYSLADAIRHLNEAPIGVIISDFKVGRMDATRLIRMMKGEHPEIISIVFSAVQDAEYVVKLINEGQVYRFIPKPFKPGFIKLVVVAALKRHKQLLDNPLLLSRFKVDSVAAGTAESLLEDIQRSAKQTAAAGAAAAPRPAVAPRAAKVPAQAPVAANEEALVGRLKTGFLRLFSRT